MVTTHKDRFLNTSYFNDSNSYLLTDNHERFVMPMERDTDIQHLTTPQKLKPVTPSVYMVKPDKSKVWTVKEERMQNLRFLKLFDKEEKNKSKFADSIKIMKEIVDPRNTYRQHRLKPLLNTTIKRSYVKKQKELDFCLEIEDKVRLFSSTWYLKNSNRNQ